MTVTYALDDRTARIHLDRPQRLNAVTTTLVEDLLAALDRATADQARCIVLAGRGRSFCAGHDLKVPVPVETPEQTAARVDRLQEITRRVRAFPGIVVAAVQGHALGAGCEIALSCDLVVADQTARFGFPEVGVGLSVTGGISHLLPRIVGPARAKELLLLGEHVTAARALELGLVNRVVPPGEHEAVAAELAARVAGRPTVAAAIAKQVVDAGLGTDMETALVLEREQAVRTSLSGEGDAPREAFAGE
ncbi:enoyl-CoA hydratase/isomerase family protein [Nocardioides marmoraquaticus]